MNKQDRFNTPSLLTLNRQFRDFMTLQYVALHSLAPEQQYFIKRRSMAELKKHRNCCDPILGIYGTDGTLLAQGILGKPGVSPYATGYPISGDANLIALVQSVSVHPEHVGQGLVAQILAALSVQAAINGQTLLMAKIAAANTPSLKAFERFGFQVMRQAQCPQNGQAYCYLRKPVFG